MPKRKKNESPTRSTDVDDCPIWNASAGDLYWRGCLVLHLAAQAHTERAILDRLEELRWRFVAKNPLARDSQQLQHVLGKYWAEGPQDGARLFPHWRWEVPALICALRHSLSRP